MNTEELIQRAERARQIIEDPLYVEAWSLMERGIVEKIAAADVTKPEPLAKLVLALQTIRGQRAVMRAWIAEGEDAARREQQKQDRPMWLNRFSRVA